MGAMFYIKKMIKLAISVINFNNKKLFLKNLFIVLFVCFPFYLSSLIAMDEESNPNDYAKKLYNSVLSDKNEKSLNKLTDFAEENKFAKYSLGLLYEQGCDLIDSDRKKAIQYYFNAAKDGHERALDKLFKFSKRDDHDGMLARHYLGLFYSKKQDLNESAWWHYKAVKLSSTRSLEKLQELAGDDNNIHAQYYLGCLYTSGQGAVKKKLNKAARWHYEAAKQSDKESLKELKTLAEKDGNAYAQYYLGCLYKSGQGAVKKDLNESAAWHYEAARQSDEESLKKLKTLAEKDRNAYAQYYLGEIYCNAEGVEENCDIAVYYYGCSARQRYKDAQKKLLKLLDSSTEIYKEDKKIILSLYHNSNNISINQKEIILGKKETGEEKKQYGASCLIPDFLPSSNESVAKFEINTHILGNKSFARFIDRLSSFKALTILTFKSNNVSDLKGFPDLCSLSGLTHLDLSSNLLVGNFFENFENNKMPSKLKKLIIKNNNIPYKKFIQCMEGENFKKSIKNMHEIDISFQGPKKAYFNTPQLFSDLIIKWEKNLPNLTIVFNPIIQKIPLGGGLDIKNIMIANHNVNLNKWQDKIKNLNITIECPQDIPEFSVSFLAVDPAGSGSDPTGYAHICTNQDYTKFLIQDAGSITEPGYSEKASQQISTLINNNDIKTVIVESDYGGGCYGQLYANSYSQQKIDEKLSKCLTNNEKNENLQQYESIKKQFTIKSDQGSSLKVNNVSFYHYRSKSYKINNIQQGVVSPKSPPKGERIIHVLESLFNQKSIYVSKNFFENDMLKFSNPEIQKTSFLYQALIMSKDFKSNSSTHDDVIDAVAIGIGWACARRPESLKGVSKKVSFVSKNEKK